MPPKAQPQEPPHEPRHQLYRTIARVHEIPIPVEAKAVLLSLAFHGNWETRTDCWPAIDTIARDASLSERHVQRTLRRLACRADEAARGLCIGDAKCPHWGLIELERFAEPGGRPASWALHLDPTMFQLQMPEVGRPEAALVATRAPRRTCSFADCSRPHHARGLCEKHYRRRLRHGDAAEPGRQAVFGTTRGRVDKRPAAGGQPAAAAWTRASA